MLSLALTPGFWDWFILAAVLLLLEVMAPGTFMLWLGLSAILVGLISFFVDWGWQYQGIAFAAFAIAAIPLWRRLAMRAKAPTDQPFLNRRADAFVGREFTLVKPIIDHAGTIGIDDTVWRVTGPDCPAGTRVRVAAVDGAMLRVEIA
jgi:inner membrane protein